MSFSLQQEKVTKKCRPYQALHRKNSTHIAVDSHAVPPRVSLKRHPCRFTPIWTPFFRGLERGQGCHSFSFEYERKGFEVSIALLCAEN